MTELSGLQIFKHLPAAKKGEGTNCKKCGFPTCMAFALKLAKNQAGISLCEHASSELKEIFEYGMKKSQQEITIGNVKIGGENVLYRHDKTFINPTAIAIVVDTDKPNWQEKLERIKNFEITRINDTLKVDLIWAKGKHAETIQGMGVTVVCDEKLPLVEIKEDSFQKTAEKLVFTREKAVLEKDENYSTPVYVHLEHTEDLNDLCARAAYYICKYANMLMFEDFDEAMISTLMTLRQNIFTDPQKPLKVEAKVYEFNNPDENALVFLTTNFALTYFAVANELEALNTGSYLIVTPSDGMSVLTAWSAEKFTAQIVAKSVTTAGLAEKVKNKRIIIPGLLAHMQDELQEAIPDFEIVVGTNEAYLISDFIKAL